MSRIKRALIFDLDGTLIDSAPSILSGFEHVFKVNGIEPLIPLVSSLIGPPLVPTLKMLSGIEDGRKLQAMAMDFKEYYDFEGFKLSQPYEGVSDGLKALAKTGLNLHIATNKRFYPTQNIANHLGWSDIFSSIYTLDKEGASFKSKSEMICRQLKDLRMSSEQTIYVGDRVEDMEAALSNQVSFVGVSWGYGDFPSTTLVIQKFDQLYNAIGMK